MRPKLSFRRTFSTSLSRPNRHRAPVHLAVEALEARLALTNLPAGFTETLVTTGVNLSGPTAMTISPTGQLWVLEQAGRVRFIDSNGTTPATPAKTLTVDSAGERGLLGIAFDPSYDGAGPNADYVYLYYTVPRDTNAPPTNPNPANNQISRFPVLNAGTNTPTLGDPDITRELPPEDEDNNLGTDGDTNHNGGALHFGTDGKLYVAVGDHNYDPTNRADSPAQKKDIPFGKILRLNPDLTNPTDNPFSEGATNPWQGAIWAMGLRNPFRFAVQPGSGTIYINDVGESTWEEINLGQPGANYGWSGSTAPLYEGFEPNPANQTIEWENYQNPLMAYRHDSTLPTSSAITGGVFYPAGGSFGSAYAGKYFYADLNGRYIRVFDPANPGTYVPGNPTASHQDTSIAFADTLTSANPVDLAVDAAGNLYYLAIGGPGEIYRISTTSAVVAGRHLFYNNSAFDDGTTAVSTLDNNAIATDKTAYLPNGGTATFENVSSYTQGINGIMIDLAGSGTHASVNSNDFVFRVGNSNTPGNWSAAPAPTSIAVRTGGGVNGSDRVEITWANGGILNTWLEVQVLATTRTGLASADVFFWGNKVGDTGAPSATQFSTTVSGDGGNILAGLTSSVGITNVRDIDRSNTVTVAGDRGDVLANLGTIVRLKVGPAGPFAPEGGGATAGIASALAATSTGAPESSPPQLSEGNAGRSLREELKASRVTAYFRAWETERSSRARLHHASDKPVDDAWSAVDECLDALVAGLRPE